MQKHYRQRMKKTLQANNAKSITRRKAKIITSKERKIYYRQRTQDILQANNAKSNIGKKTETNYLKKYLQNLFCNQT